MVSTTLPLTEWYWPVVLLQSGRARQLLILLGTGNRHSNVLGLAGHGDSGIEVGWLSWRVGDRSRKGFREESQLGRGALYMKEGRI